ncbi:unnamed protein product [Rotaria socialis]|uniref:Tetraspanin n=1 Tax=Rotaria socialis TaxID=392032 RepID=A0A817MJY5_9BILA|nr:unnamed protein product [Rotaria socialis]CAF3335123.1 unnamed protein product [Rotaria socialis]CAF3356171.1 unnamed protein product [Rotaria socialis]CAF3453335.1 unnamed protein product [Rotaria socialis]CAF3533514.1 unnamed protein product [Rotaria socialis]
MGRFSCGIQCTRATLFGLNILFVFVGFTVMGLGIYIKVNGNFSSISEIYKVSQALGSEAMQWIGVGMIVAGIFTALLAAFGCLGAVLKNRCFLYLYAVLLSLIVFFEFGAVITTLVFRNDLWKTYDSSFVEIFNHAYGENQTATIQIIEDIEHRFKCCGVDGPSDYAKFGYRIPRSCYPNKKAIAGLPYTEGCAQAVAIWVWNQLPLIAGSLGALLFIEIFGVISSIALGVAISHSSNVEDYHKF